MSKKTLIEKLKTEFLGGGLLFLCNLSLITVGFSAWAIEGVGIASLPVSVEVQDVVDLNDIFLIQEPRMFQYGSHGIIRDETIVSDGYVYFPILIQTTHQDYAKVRKNDDGSLPFSVSISNVGGFDLFNESYLSRSSEGVVDGAYSAGNSEYSEECPNAFSSSISGNVITASLSLSSDGGLLSQNVYLMLAFHFSFSDFSAVYDSLSTNGLSFSIVAKAEVL